jgi:hypothetical protein
VSPAEAFRVGKAALLLAAVLIATPGFAQQEPEKPPRLKFYGDVRLRGESDWDSLQPDGTERTDRDRLRARFRLGFNYAYDDHITFGARIRTGNPLDQQSPHQTLGDEFESKGFNIDRAFIHGGWSRGWVWGGKNLFPFWMQNELFWDEDVTPEGVAAGLTLPLGGSRVRLKPTLGWFVMEGSGSSNRFSEKSHLSAGQVAAEAGFKPVDIVGAVGFYSFDDNPATTDTALADLDYAIWVGSVKATFKGAPKPISVGVDYMRNTQDYAATVFNGDQDTGYVFGLNLGQLKQRKDWLVGYYYAHIEKFAVVARLAQDDWLRWGSTTDTRSSNFEGHEIRLAYAFGPSWNAVLRVYRVKGIALETPTAIELEDGNRARLDLNISF